MNTRYHARRIRVLVAAAVIGALASNFAAATSDVNGAPAITVKFSDLDLAKPQGAAALYRRIQAAADTVCSPFEGRDLTSIARQHACVHKAIADAVTAVNLPTLSAVYNAKHPTGTSPALVSQVR